MVIFFVGFGNFCTSMLRMFQVSNPWRKKYREKAADCRCCRVTLSWFAPAKRHLFYFKCLLRRKYSRLSVWRGLYAFENLPRHVLSYRVVWGWNASEGSLLTCEKCGKVLWKPILCLLNLCEDWVRSSFRLGQLAYAVHEDRCYLWKENLEIGEIPVCLIVVLQKFILWM